MNRKQAKILSKLTTDEVCIMMPNFNPDCFDMMRKFGDGEEIFLAETGESYENFDFTLHKSRYRTNEKRNIVNGHQLKNRTQKPMLNHRYYTLMSTRVAHFDWENSQMDNDRFNFGNCFKTEKDAQEAFDIIWKKSYVKE